jgi:flagellar basal body-associated protein FliL
MARPTPSKDIKPDDIEAELTGDGGGGGSAMTSALDLKFIITIVVILLAGIGGSVATTLFLAPMVLGPVIQESVAAAGGGGHGEGGGEHGGEHGDGHHGGSPSQTIGNTLALDEFTVNLKSDPTIRGNQFLRTKMSLSVAVPDEEYCAPGSGEHAMVKPFSNGLQGGRALATITPIGLTAMQYRYRAGHGNDILLASGGGGEDPMVACKANFDKHMGPYIPTFRDIINQALMKRTAGTLATVEGQEMLKDEIISQVNTLLPKQYKVVRVNFSDFIIQY